MVDLCFRFCFYNLCCIILASKPEAKPEAKLEEKENKNAKPVKKEPAKPKRPVPADFKVRAFWKYEGTIKQSRFITWLRGMRLHASAHAWRTPRRWRQQSPVLKWVMKMTITMTFVATISEVTTCVVTTTEMSKPRERFHFLHSFVNKVIINH